MFWFEAFFERCLNVKKMTGETEPPFIPVGRALTWDVVPQVGHPKLVGTLSNTGVIQPVCDIPRLD